MTTAVGAVERSAVEVVGRTATGRLRAMASDITVLATARGGAHDDPRDLAVVVAEALAVFPTVAATCTRFDPASPLMQANAAPDDWHRLPPTCVAAISEAFAAYRRTDGRFDPRVLRDLVELGYTEGLSFTGGTPEVAGRRPRRRVLPPPWLPRFRGPDEVHLGGRPVDLGGIGKGLAVRWAAEALQAKAGDHLIVAGGDCSCRGRAPDGAAWRVGVEDPAGGSEPLAVLQLSDVACATSSVRLRRWKAGGRVVHHLIDPRTGLPGGPGLAAVTVVADDPADAEVWSKVLFLAGRRNVARAAEEQGLAALWVAAEGAVACSDAMRPYLLWQAW